MTAPSRSNNGRPLSDASAASHQQELALSSVLSHRLFPGRSTLYVQEVADALETSVNQIISLIEEGKLYAINIAGGNNKSARNYWRIPVSSFDAYVRKSNKPVGQSEAAK